MAQANATTVVGFQPAEKRVGLFSTINSALRLVTTSVVHLENIVSTNLQSLEQLSAVGLEEATMMRTRSQIENNAEITQLKADLKALNL
jgi:hypothetical protein